MLTASFSVRNSHQRITLSVSLSLSLSLSLSFYLTESEFVKILVETTYGRWRIRSGLLTFTLSRVYRRMTRGSWTLVEIEFLITDRSPYARIFFLLASGSMGEKNIYYLCYSLCRSLAVVRLRLLFQSERERKREREGRRMTRSSVANRWFKRRLTYRRSITMRTVSAKEIERKAPGQRYYDCGGPGALLLSFYRKSVLRKMIRKIWGEVSVFSIPLRRGAIWLKITWVQQRQHHRALESARERMLSLTFTDLYSIL